MDASTMIWIVVAIFAVLGILVYRASGKTVANVKKGWLYALTFGVAIFLVAGNLGFLPESIGFGALSVAGDSATDAGNTVNVGGSEVCFQNDPTTITFASQNKYTSVATGGTHRYRINGGVTQTVSDLGTATASPGDKIEILFNNGTQDQSTYFSEIGSYTVPCKPTFTPGIDGSPMQLVQNGSVTINPYNRKGTLIATTADIATNVNETLGAGDVVDLKLEIRGSNQQGYPHGTALVLELNGTDFMEEKTSLTIAGLSVTPTNTPKFHSVSDVGRKTVAWDLSAFEGTTTYTGTLHLEVESSTNPKEVNPPVFWFYVKNPYVDEDNGGKFQPPAVEDEDNKLTFNHVTNRTLFID